VGGAETYLTHLLQGEPLSQPLFSLLHSRQLCWGFGAATVGEAVVREAVGEGAGGDDAEDDDAAYEYILGGCTAIIQGRGQKQILLVLVACVGWSC
jgi:hypothetical protein